VLARRRHIHIEFGPRSSEATQIADGVNVNARDWMTIEWGVGDCQGRASSYAIVLGVAVLAVVLITQPSRSAEKYEPNAVSAETIELEEIYTHRCSSCHDAATGRTPSRTALMFVPPRFIARRLTDGSMKPMAAGLSSGEIGRLAAYLSALPDRPPLLSPKRCEWSADRASARKVDTGSGDWPLTSRDGANTRFQPHPGLTKAEIPRLELVWSLAIPGGASGSPVVVDGRLYVSSGAGEILALDAKEGCTLWTFEHGGIVRTLTIGDSSASGGRALVLFADDAGMAFALDAATGDFRWATQVEDHPLNRATGAPGVHDGRVFVTMSSIEDPLTHDPSHTCCTSRGGHR